MARMIHPVAGAVALLTIGTFWVSTAVTELFAARAMVATVKSAIPWGFLVLRLSHPMTWGSVKANS
jgi:hypothetical protein